MAIHPIDKLAQRLGVAPSEILDAYHDLRSGQLVVRLTGYRRRRLTWAVRR